MKCVLRPLAMFCVLSALFATAVGAEELGCGNQQQRSGDVVALTGYPVKITVRGTTSGQSDMVSAVISIDGGARRYCVDTVLSSNDAVLEKAGRRQITWSPPYLLVRSDVSTRQEVSNKTWIFKLTDGNLTSLGAIGGDVSAAASGRFVSLYNKASIWRAQAFFCMACKPGVRLVFDDRGGKLAAAAEETWLINERERAHNADYIDAKLRAGLPPPGEDSPTRALVLGALIENAVIAKYCGRAAEAERLEALAEANLDPESKGELIHSLNEVVPEELPTRWNAVWRE